MIADRDINLISKAILLFIENYTLISQKSIRVIKTRMLFRYCVKFYSKNYSININNIIIQFSSLFNNFLYAKGGMPSLCLKAVEKWELFTKPHCLAIFSIVAPVVSSISFAFLCRHSIMYWYGVLSTYFKNILCK